MKTPMTKANNQTGPFVHTKQQDEIRQLRNRLEDFAAELAKRNKELEQCKQELAERTLKDFRENVDGAIYETLDGLLAFGNIPRPGMQGISRVVENTSHEFWTPDTLKPKLRHYALQGYKYMGHRRMVWYKEVEEGK